MMSSSSIAKATNEPSRQGDVIRGPMLVDGHVHFYDCFDRTVFLDGAAANFRRGAGRLGLGGDGVGWLLFTETARDHYFRRFRDMAGDGNGDGWRFRATSEDCALTAHRGDGALLVLLAGRQIETAEGLEVLAIGSDAEYADGRDLRETLHAVRDSGALAVLPWGFGKWWFGRGAIVREFLADADRGPILLGDNGGRPGAAPRPAIFRIAESRGLHILPGTDPLPFASQAARVGRFGFVVEGDVDRDRPAEGFKALLRNQRTQPATFGRLESLAGFCRSQLLINARKQGRKLWR